MERTLEIKNVFDFCKAIAYHPKEIIKNEQLQKVLNFCYVSVVNCNCNKNQEIKATELDSMYMQNIENLNQETKIKLGEILSNDSKYSSVYICSSTTDKKIQVK